MPSTWNRRVTATADGLHLQVDEVTDNPNPPGRSDSADTITVKTSDRPATINYKADGVTITGIEMKNGGAVPDGLEVQTLPNGFLRLTDSGAAGTDYSYYLVGDYAANRGIKTEDPQIHNIDR